jgi:hypothetical protein
LQGTSNYGIRFQAKGQDDRLVVYSDADFAGDKTNRRSRSGVVSMSAGGALSWLSQLQTSVALSTTEAELMAASEGAKEAIWLQKLFRELTDFEAKSTLLLIDNLSCVKLTRNPEFHKRTKHIDVRYFFVREKVLDGSLNTQHIAGEEQTADIFTKALPRVRFTKLRAMLGVCGI